MPEKQLEKPQEPNPPIVSTISSGLKDLSSDIRLILYERLSNPVVGSIILSAIAFHSKEILLIVFAGEKRFSIINDLEFNPWKLLLIIIVGVLYAFLGPWLHAIYSGITKNSKIDSIKIENDITSNKRLSLDQSRHLMARINALQPTVIAQASEIDQLKTDIHKITGQLIDSENKFDAQDYMHKEELSKLNEKLEDAELKLEQAISNHHANVHDLLEFLKRVRELSIDQKELGKPTYPKISNMPLSANSITIEYPRKENLYQSATIHLMPDNSESKLLRSLL